MSLAQYVPLNFAIMRHPANWLIVGFMVLIAALAFQVASPLINVQKEPANG